MKLGAFFPDDERLAHVRRVLVPGAILYLFCNFTRPPKQKYAVLVCIEEEVVLFLINSNISEWLESRAYLRDCQVTLHSRSHPFLLRDSFVDCTEAIRHFKQDDLEKALLEDLSCHKGSITDEERAAILYATENCGKIERRIKKWVQKALGPPN